MAFKRCKKCNLEIKLSQKKCPSCGSRKHKLTLQGYALGAIILVSFLIIIPKEKRNSRDELSENRSQKHQLVEESKSVISHEAKSQIGQRDKVIQDEFKKWLLKNTAVIEVHFESNWQIWARLSPDKYTSKDNVEQIAESIAQWYAKKMGKNFTVCTIWNQSGSKIFAKGTYPSN